MILAREVCSNIRDHGSKRRGSVHLWSCTTSECLLHNVVYKKIKISCSLSTDSSLLAETHIMESTTPSAPTAKDKKKSAKKCNKLLLNDLPADYAFNQASIKETLNQDV